MGVSNAAYLVAPEARSRAGGYIYLGNKASNQNIFNDAVLLIARIIENVMASAAEAEVGALYINAREMVPLRVTLEELGHQQPSTALRIDNSTANNILNGTVKQRCSRAIDVHFYWLKNRAEQGQSRVFWAPVAVNFWLITIPNTTLLPITVKCKQSTLRRHPVQLVCKGVLNFWFPCLRAGPMYQPSFP